MGISAQLGIKIRGKTMTKEELESIEKLTGNTNRIISKVSQSSNELNDLLEDYNYNYGYNSRYNFMEVVL